MLDKNVKHKYSPCYLSLFKLNNGKDLAGGVTFINSVCSEIQRDTHVECDKELEAGTYVLYADIQFRKEVSNEGKTFALTRYGPSACEFEDFTKLSGFNKLDVLKAVL